MSQVRITGHGGIAISGPQTNAEKAVEDLEVRHYACAYHREPFRSTWPKGFSEYAISVATSLLERAPRFAEMAAGDFGKVERLLGDSPACEWLERGQLMEAYHESGVGYKARCSICGLKRSGTPFLLRSGEIGVPFKHVCFACVVDKKGGLATRGGVTVNPEEVV